MSVIGASGAYASWWLADILHSFPHLDLALRPTNSTFRPNTTPYRESLVFWAAVPILWLLLTLLVFLIYFCYRCCQKDVEKRQNGTCLQWTMAILALITCGAIGVGFYGNEKSHTGLVDTADSTRDIDHSVRTMVLQINHIDRYISRDVSSNVQELRTRLQRNFEAHNINGTLYRQLKRMSGNARRSAAQISNTLNTINSTAIRVHLSNTAHQIDKWEHYRWVVLIGLLCWELLLCLLLLLGIGKTSKCTLLLFCALGIFTLVLCWAMAGIHLGGSVSLGDFCVAPDAYVEFQATKHVNRDIARYYIKCDERTRNPFGGSLRSAVDGVSITNNTLHQITTIAETFMQENELQTLKDNINYGLVQTVDLLHQLTALVQCTNINKDYQATINSICYQLLPGTVFILLSAVIVALLQTALVLLASCAWRHFGRRQEYDSKGYCEVDEDDPFIPRGTSLSGQTSSDNTSPSYYSFTRGRQNREQPGSILRRSSPPPAASAPQQATPPTAGMMIGKTNSLCLHNRSGMMIGRHHHTPANLNRMSVPQPVAIPVNMLQQSPSQSKCPLPGDDNVRYQTLPASVTVAQPSVVCGATAPTSSAVSTLSSNNSSTLPHPHHHHHHGNAAGAAAMGNANNSGNSHPQHQHQQQQEQQQQQQQQDTSDQQQQQQQKQQQTPNKSSDWPDHPPPWTSL